MFIYIYVIYIYIYIYTYTYPEIPNNSCMHIFSKNN